MYVTNVTVLRGERYLTEVTAYDILEAVHRVHDLETLRFCCPVIIIKFYYFSGRKKTRATDRPLQIDRKRNKQPERKGKAEREERRTERQAHIYKERESINERERERERERGMYRDTERERQTE